MNNQLTPIQKATNFISRLEEKFTELTIESESTLQFKKESTFAIQLLQSNDFLLKMAVNNPDSLKSAILNISSIGLTLNPMKNFAYLIPRKGKVCLEISYLGLIDIACDNTTIKFIQSKIVHENDTFNYKGISQEPEHVFSPFKDRGEAVGVYCIAKLEDGDFLTEIMTIDECNEIRNRSESFKRGKSSPWTTDYFQMVRKTCVRRFVKFLPKTKKTNALDLAIEKTSENENINFEAEKKEAEEKENEEVKKRIAEQKAESQKEREEKKEIIDEIARLAGEKCQGKTPQEKGCFMIDVMKVKSFDDLERKSLVELNAVLNAVDWQE